MIRQAATSTNVRKEKIEKILKEINYNRSMTVQKFGLRVDDKFAQIPARILDAPRLEYSCGKTIQPKLGVWRPDNMPFITSMNATQWGVLVLDDRTREPLVNDFCRKVRAFIYLRYETNISTALLVILIYTYSQYLLFFISDHSGSQNRIDEFQPEFIQQIPGSQWKTTSTGLSNRQSAQGHKSCWNASSILRYTRQR